MKKTKLVCLTILGLLFLLPFAKFSIAQGAYVGVAVGQRYAWRNTIFTDDLDEFYNDGMNTTLNSLGFNTSYIPFLWLDLGVPIVDTQARVESIGTEMTSAFFAPRDNSSITYTQTTISLIWQDFTAWGPIWDNQIYPIVSTGPNLFSQTNSCFYMFNPLDFCFNAMIVPNNLNWLQFIQYASLNYTAMGFPFNAFQFSTLSSGFLGFNMTIPAGLLGGSQKQVEAIAVYHANTGVLKWWWFSYNGVRLVQYEIQGASPPSPEIPGYEVPIVIAISAMSILSIIYLIRKRKKSKV